MPETTTRTLDSIVHDLKSVWGNYDSVWDSMQNSDWTKKFGKDWTFQDQPYHLAYLTRMAARNISEGENLPAVEQELAATPKGIDEYNARKFSDKPGGLTVDETRKQLIASRDALLAAVSAITDDDMDSKAWLPIGYGWTTKRNILMFCLVHDVGEYAELSLRRGGNTPTPPEAAIHSRLEFMMEFMSMLAKPENAGSQPFRLVWNFEGPGGGAWTLSVADGECELESGRASDPDVVMTTTFAGFEKMTRKMSNPMWMMLTRQVKVKGFFKMRKMSKIFAEPAPDEVLIKDGRGPLTVG